MLQYLEGKKVVCGNTYIMSPKRVGGHVYVQEVVFTVVYISIPMCYHTNVVMFPKF